jgi:alpha-glucosidase
MPMDFMFTTINKLSPADFRKQIQWVDGSGGWPVYVLSNHDIRRVYDRYGDGQHNDQIAKLMASLYLTLRGTPVMYYGEEIGMENNDPKRPEDVKDSMGKAGWPKEKGRDGERTPMQWSAEGNAGFSAVTPWLPVGERYKSYNVESEKKDPHSILNYYRQLLSMRHTNSALLEGRYIALNENDPNVLAYARSYREETVLVVLNMSGVAQRVRLDLASKGLRGKDAKTLLSSFSAPTQVDNGEISVEPFGAWVGETE